MFRAEAKQKIQLEIYRGEAARREGFEGRARVCARRAAGAAIREFLVLQALPVPGLSAMDLLEALRGVSGISDRTEAVVERLLMRVDEDYRLPEDVDLLEDARRLAQELEELCRRYF